MCLLEAAPTIDDRTKTSRKLATLGVFHQTIGEIEDLSQIPRPTFFRIWITPLIADRVIGHAPWAIAFRPWQVEPFSAAKVLIAIPAIGRRLQGRVEGKVK